MGKLIRDKIPEIILADGKQAIVREMGQEEYLIELDKKLLEEVNEYKESKIIRRWMWNQHQQRKPMSKSNKKVKRQPHRQLHRQLAIQMVGQDC